MAMQVVTMADVRVGAALKWPIYDRHKRLLFRKGAVIHSEKQLEMLLKMGLQRLDGADENAEQDHTPPVANPFDRIEQVIERLPLTTRMLFMASAENGSPDGAEFVKHMRHFADELMSVCQIDADAALGHIHLAHHKPFSQCHPVHTAILAFLVGIHLDVAPERLTALVCAALTANATITPMMENMHKQTFELTPAQQQVFNQHPQSAHDLLAQAGVTDKDWLEIVLQHHERADGAGYPQKLQGEAVCSEAMILGLADEYYSMVFEVPGKPAPSPHLAIKNLFVKHKDDALAPYVSAMIKELGIYPPGTLVTLANKEAAVVVWRNSDNTKPVVKAITNEQGGPLLTPRERNTRSSLTAISDLYQARMALHLNLAAMWGYTP